MSRDDGLVGEREFLLQNDETLRALQFSADGRFLVSHDLSDDIKIWNMRGALFTRIRKPLERDDGYTGFVLSPDGSRMITIGYDKVTTVWTIGSPKNLKSLDDLREPDGSTFFEPSVIQRLADHFRTRGQRLLEGEDWPPRSEVTLETVAQTEAGAPRDAERLKAVWQRNSDTEVRILTQEEERDVAVLRGHEKPVQSVAFKPGSDIVASVSGGSLRLWSAETGEQIASVGEEGLSGAAYRARRVFFNSQGSRLFVVSEDFVDVFDAQSLQNILSLASEDVIQNANPPPDFFEVSEGKFISVLEAAWQPEELSLDRTELAPRFWLHPHSTQELIDYEKQTVTRCLMPSQMREYFLGDEPPRWCITGPGLTDEPDASKWQPKRPYQSAEWRDWLLARDRGEDRPVPSPAPLSN
jgi:hypothetical protein